jgi:hypothetical protein
MCRLLITTVFLHLSPNDPKLEPPIEESEASLHWVPLSALLSPRPTWSFVTVDISSRLAPRHNILRTAVRILVGNMRFRALVLTRDDLEEVDDLHRLQVKKREAIPLSQGQTEELKVWGLTLGMTL